MPSALPAQAEKHIRNNALRLNLAERLAAADSASSEISSEVSASGARFVASMTAWLPAGRTARQPHLPRAVWSSTRRHPRMHQLVCILQVQVHTRAAPTSRYDAFPPRFCAKSLTSCRRSLDARTWVCVTGLGKLTAR